MNLYARILAGTAVGLFLSSAPLVAQPLVLAQADTCAEGETAEACAARQEHPAEESPAESPAQPAPEPEPQAEEPAPEVERAAPEQSAPEPQSQAEEVKPAQEQHGRDRKTPAENPPPEVAPAEPAPVPVEPAPATDAPVIEAPAAQEPAARERPARERPSHERPARERPDRPQRPDRPVEQLTPAIEEPANPDAAPLFDSQKGEPAATNDAGAGADHPSRNGRPDGERVPGQSGEPATPPAAPVDIAPPPVDDRAAQEAITPQNIAPVTAEKGKRRERAPETREQERPSGADVLREIGNRVILQLGNQTIVESNEQPRLSRGARDVYYEDLPRGRTREVIVRNDGSQVVTITNRNGEVIQRSRITPDGEEYILNYVDERSYDERYDNRRQWRDPGADLPPMRLNVPRNEYILETRRARDPEAYYDFLEQPPVERIQRLYSVDEVKRSARVRDIARRIDLDTLNFDTGSASVNRVEVRKLENMADAMLRMLDRNPAETFLIEGHTDAIGSDESNLALSDRRAEGVADALTDIFGIPPENLTTQGYGERYLKIKTQLAEPENRRVTIRRITPLVAPVARN